MDRFGRSLQDLIAFLSEIHAVGVDLYLHQQGLDTSTPAGKAMFQTLGVFAEFERALIRERVMAGLARAKKHGTKTGNPFGRPKIDPAAASPAPPPHIRRHQSDRSRSPRRHWHPCCASGPSWRSRTLGIPPRSAISILRPISCAKLVSTRTLRMGSGSRLA